jgi:hypothetical protein
VVAKYIFGFVLEGIIGSFFGKGASHEQKGTELVLFEGHSSFHAHAASPDLVLVPIVARKALFVQTAFTICLLESIICLFLLLPHVVEIVLVVASQVPPVRLIRHPFFI